MISCEITGRKKFLKPHPKIGEVLNILSPLAKTCEFLSISGFTIRKSWEPGKDAGFERTMLKGTLQFTDIQ
jgi:hypothetical protein